MPYYEVKRAAEDLQPAGDDAYEIYRDGAYVADYLHSAGGDGQVRLAGGAWRNCGALLDFGGPSRRVLNDEGMRLFGELLPGGD